jgi:hypothetical protein
MDTVQVRADLLERMLRLAYGFGEPSFLAIVGEGDGTSNGIEEGRGCVLDAEIQLVANYATPELALAERRRDLLNLLTDELSDEVPLEIRERALKGL